DLIDAIACGIRSRVVQLLLGEKKMRVEQLSVDLESLVRRPRRGGGVFVREHARESGMCRSPLRVESQRVLERAQRFAALILLEKEQPPAGVDRRIVAGCKRAVD